MTCGEFECLPSDAVWTNSVAYVMLKKQDRGGGEMIRGKWKWLLILLAALAVLVGLMAVETLLGSVRKCG